VNLNERARRRILWWTRLSRAWNPSIPNAETVGKLYAGDIWHAGVETYYDPAFKLGKKLVL